MILNVVLQSQRFTAGEDSFVGIRELRLQHRRSGGGRPRESRHLHQRGLSGRAELRVPPGRGAAQGAGRGEKAEGGDRPAAVRGRGAREDGREAVREGEDSPVPVSVEGGRRVHCMPRLFCFFGALFAVLCQQQPTPSKGGCWARPGVLFLQSRYARKPVDRFAVPRY